MKSKHLLILQGTKISEPKLEHKDEHKRDEKYCPVCGSTKIHWASGFPQFWSFWDCKECGYRGALVLEDGTLGAKLRKEWKNPKIKPKGHECVF